MQQAREEKQLETALESIIQRVNDLKTSIAAMIYKVENEYDTLNWPTFLDNYALLSGHLTSLSKLLNHDKCPPLRNLTVLPLLLSPERDEQLVQVSEGRITTFAHDLVPDYLRTKLEPMAENKMLQLEHKAATLTYENAQKQITAYQKVVSHVWDIVNKAREEWEVESSARGNTQQNSSVADTHMLVAAVGMGKGLKILTNPNGQPNQNSGGIMVAPQGPGRPPGAQPGQVNLPPSSTQDKSFKTLLQQNHILRGLITDTLLEIKEMKKLLIQRTTMASLEVQDKQVFFKTAGINFPINSEEELEHLEQILQNEETFQNGVNELSKLGGSSVYDLVKRIFTAILSNDQALKYSWLGRKQKKAFSNLNVAKLLIKSAEQSGLANSQKATEIAIQTWLRRASDRRSCLLKKS